MRVSWSAYELFSWPSFKPHLVAYNESILVGQWTFQLIKLLTMKSWGTMLFLVSSSFSRCLTAQQDKYLAVPIFSLINLRQVILGYIVPVAMNDPWPDLKERYTWMKRKLPQLLAMVGKLISILVVSTVLTGRLILFTMWQT